MSDSAKFFGSRAGPLPNKRGGELARFIVPRAHRFLTVRKEKRVLGCSLMGYFLIAQAPARWLGSTHDGVFDPNIRMQISACTHSFFRGRYTVHLTVYEGAGGRFTASGAPSLAWATPPSFGEEQREE